MNCDDFKDRIDESPGGDITSEMASHAANCDRCAQYMRTVRALTPAAWPDVSPDIKAGVLEKIEKRKFKQPLKNFLTMKSRTSKMAASLAAAAMIAAIVVLNVTPVQVRAAEKLIARSLAAADGIKSMVMKIDVRTGANENFSVIDPGADMVEHTLTVDMGDPSSWRLEKSGGRTAMFDGTAKYFWHDGGSSGFKTGAGTNVEEWFGMLLDPRLVLWQEKASVRERGVKYSVESLGERIVMTARVAARGDFTNPYLRNTSIEESDTRREIVFDRATDLIAGLRIFAVVDGAEVLVVEVKSVQYVPVDTKRLTALPEGYRWQDIDLPAAPGGKFKNITAAQAAKLIADAMNGNDLGSVREAFVYYDFDFIAKRFRGAKVSLAGEPFRSGLYPGVFVPVMVEFPDKSAEKLNIALRNDTPGGGWVVDGGI